MRNTRDGFSLPGHSLIFAVIVFLHALVVPVAAGEGAGEGSKAVVSGVVFDNTIERDGKRLDIIGAGIMRYMIVLRGYAAALYLGEGHASTGLFDDIPKWLEIEYYHDIPAQGFIKATQHGLEANLSAGELERLASRIDSLYACYQDIRKHDRYSFVYLPDSGAELLLNGKLLCRFDGLDFANAVFSIWLGRNPLDAKLKRHLLGE